MIADQLLADHVRAAAQRRRIGWWGTAVRIAVGASLVFAALTVWHATRVEMLVGLVALPAVATGLMLLRGRSAKPLRLGAAGHLITAGHIGATFAVMPEAAALFYGSTAVVAGIHGNAGCEITALANWVRDRDDQVGCPVFAIFDVLDEGPR
jgi:hypothetical protein